MKQHHNEILIFFSLVFFISCRQKNDDPDLKLWYDRPATIWEEALPLGNGKTGAMVFGGVVSERIQINDLTLWSGYPIDTNNPEGPGILEKTREAVFKGDYIQAGEEWKKIHGPYCARYLPMGDLSIRMRHKDTVASEYYRDLDIQKAISTVRYTAGGVVFKRESFVSHPDKIMVIRLTCDKPGSLSFEASLSSKLRFTTEILPDNTLIMKGKAPYHVAHRAADTVQVGYRENDGEGTNFEIRLKIDTEGGRISVSGDKLIVDGASEVKIYVAGTTSYNGFDKSPGLNGKDPAIEAAELIKNAFRKTYEDIKTAHLTDFRELFDRVSLNLGSEEEAVKLPTDERLLRFNSGKSDLQLQSLYYQFGRYLLISCSRDQAMPANLQGLWNDHVQPPWGSNYTTNINLEMNYWPAESTNLTECHAPLLTFINSLSVNGRKTAKINFGLEGWCVFHNSDIWAKTSPPGGGAWDKIAAPRWSCWPMGGAWLCQDLFRHYEYTGNLNFLHDTAWPIMKGASEFLLGWLIEGPDGYLVTNPSTSPENIFKIDEKTMEVSMASTMDMSIARDLFSNCIQTLDILNTRTGV